MSIPVPLPFPPYTPEDWYWIIGGDATHVWSSRRAALIEAASDVDFQDWSTNKAPTNIGTMAELEQVLAVQFPPGTPNSYNPAARYIKATGGIIVTSISPRMFSTDLVDRNAMANALDYVKATPAATIDWKLPDGTFITLNQAQLQLLVETIPGFVTTAFTVEKANATAILGGTMTTIAEIDAAYAALSNVFP